MIHDITHAVLLAAGKGTRLRPLTETVPKPLLHVAGRPILERTITALPRSVTDVVIVVGYLEERIRTHFGAQWGGRTMHYVTQSDLHGTGAAIHCARHLLNGRFLALNGDDLFAQEDMERAMAYELAIQVMPMDGPARFGSLETNADGTFNTIGPSPEDGPSLINTGLYVLDERYFDYPLVKIRNGEFGLPQTLATIAQDHPVMCTYATFWVPIGYPEDLDVATDALRKYEGACV